MRCSLTLTTVLFFVGSADGRVFCSERPRAAGMTAAAKPAPSLLLEPGADAAGSSEAARPEQGASAGQEKSGIEAAVLEASAKMTQAAEALDAQGLFSYMMENDKGSIIQNGVFLATRQEALDQVLRNLRNIQKVAYTWKRQHVTVLSPAIALLTADGEVTAETVQGTTFTSPLSQTLVFVLEGGQWKVLHAHQSSPARR